MIKKRIGNTFQIRWKVNTEGVTLSELDLMLQRNEPMKKVMHIPFTIEDGNTLVFRHEGKDQKSCGIYTYTLYANYAGDSQGVVDSCNGVELVPSSCQAGGEDSNISIDDVITLSSDTMILGVPGQSAYEVAVDNGFQGSEEEWLLSLRGPKGDSFKYSDFTPEQITALQKPALDAIEPINKKVEILEQNRIKQIIWNKSSNANSITEKGLYLLEGVHSNSGDNLPTVAYANGYVGGFMSVTVTTKDEALNEQVIGQNLTLSNKVSGETKQYIRSCIIKNETVSWSAWKEVNTIQMFGIKSSGIATKADIDAAIDIGQYAGIYMGSDGFLPQGATFTLTVINNYAATAASSLPAENRQVTQMFVYTPLSTDGSVNKSIVCKRDGIGRSSISWGELESVVNNTSAPFYIGDVNAICSNKYSSHEDILRVMEVTPYELWDAVRQKRFIYSVTSNSSPILIQVLASTDKNSTYGQFNISFLFPNIDYYTSIFTFIVNVKLYYNGKINEWKSLETIKYDYSGLPKS